MSNVRLRRLAADFERMQSYVRRHPRVKLVQVEGSPPEKYQLQYVVRSLRQVGGEVTTVDSHMVEIVLPRNYPRTPPQCRMLSPVFHPNVAPHAICVGDHWGAGEPLESIVVRIGEMLAYQSYNVKSPLNGDAARWVEQNLDRVPTDKVSMLAEEDASPSAAAAPPFAAPPPFAPANPFGAAPPFGAAVPPFAPATPPDSGYQVGPVSPVGPQSGPPMFAPPQYQSPQFPPQPQQPPPQFAVPPAQQQQPQQSFAPPGFAVPGSVPPPATPAAASAPQAMERMKVSCPGCGKNYVVPAANKGRTAKCQNCRETFTL